VDLFTLVLAFPLIGGLLLTVFGERAWAPNLNVITSLGTFLSAVLLTAEVVAHGSRMAFGEMFFIDSLNVFLVTLTAFVGLTTSIFSGPYMRNEREHGKLTVPRLRLYKSMFQLFMFTMLVALTTNNMGILWVAMEAATLTTVLLVSLYRTPASLEAAWKYFILCGVGIAQALFGTILLYFAAERVLGETGNALLWTHLVEVKGQLEPNIMALSFIFLLIGYGTKVGLAPLHNWLPDAHAEGAVHSGYAGHLMMGFGLTTLIMAAFFLSRQKDIKRMFAYSSIEHMGIITFAFGMGGPVANFAGLLHMTLHSLTKSAIFFAVGHAAQKTGSQLMENIRGLIRINPVIGWGLMLGTLAILGMPPFGVFASEFMILTHAMKYYAWATPVLLIALGVAFAAIFGKVQPMVFGETHAKPLPHAPAITPVFVHLGIVLMLGLYIPPYLTRWFHEAARMLG